MSSKSHKASSPERAFAEILRELNESTRELIHHEFRLVRAEVRENIQKLKVAAALVGAGLALGLVALVCLALGATHGLGELMPDWAAALAVAGGLGLGVALLVRAGVGRLEEIDMDETVESLADDKEFVESELQELKRQVST